MSRPRAIIVRVSAVLGRHYPVGCRTEHPGRSSCGVTQKTDTRGAMDDHEPINDREEDAMRARDMARLRRLTELRKRLNPHPAEGRRGRQRREISPYIDPALNPPPIRIPEETSKAREKATRAANRDLMRATIATVARKTYLDNLVVGDVLGHFMEEVGRHLLDGRCVVIPGLGAFCPRPSQPPKPGTGSKRKQRIYTAFAAWRNMAVLMAEHARFDQTAYEQWQNFRKNHRPSGRSWRRIAESPAVLTRQAWRNVVTGSRLKRRRLVG